MARRFPARIGNWKISKGDYSQQGLINILRLVIREQISRCKCPAILLSGGVDSSILAGLVREIIPDISCITIGASLNHPDVVAAEKLAEYWDLNHYIYLPSNRIIEKARQAVDAPFYPGDECVFIALDFSVKIATDILAADGIDEQMGGYWWHVNRNDQFPQTEQAFKHFWDELESKHLQPMFRSAQKIGINIHWIYLEPRVVQYISMIPFDVRVRKGIGKFFWRETALALGVPEWIINRPKRGFVDALSR